MSPSPSGDQWLAGLAAALEPYLWVGRASVITLLGPGTGPPWWAEVDGIVKPPADFRPFGMTPWKEACENGRQFRAVLMAQAEAAIAAAEGAGWEHESGPRVDVRGDVRHDLRRGTVIMPAECTVELRLWPPAEALLAGGRAS